MSDFKKYPFKYSCDGGRYVTVSSKCKRNVKMIAKLRNPGAKNITIKRLQGTFNNYNTHNQVYMNY